MFVFAHPDDESFSSGGTIAKLAKLRHNIILITATKGEEGLIGDPPVTTKENVGKTREQELRLASKILGIKKVKFLGFIDATLSKCISALKPKILKILQKELPDIVVTFDKHGGSNHPDHIAISKSTTQAFEKYMKLSKKHVRLYHTATPRSYLKKYDKEGLSYTVFGKIKGTKNSDITTIVDIGETFSLKVAALKMHKTQNKDVDRYLKRSKIVNLKKEFFKLIRENNLA